MTPMASTLSLVAHQDCTFALCALEMIETCKETLGNIHGNEGNFFISPMNSFSNRRRIASRTKNPSQNQDAVGLALQGNAHKNGIRKAITVCCFEGGRFLMRAR